MFYNKVNTATDRYNFAKSILYLLINVKVFEYGDFAFIKLYNIYFIGGKSTDVVAYFLIHHGVVHMDIVERFIQQVAQDGGSAIDFTYNFLRSFGIHQFCSYRFPFGNQVR